MSELVHIPARNTAKLKSGSCKKEWNEYQHLATEGHYIEPRIFSGLQNQRIKLTTVQRQGYPPKSPTMRRLERDEGSYRLSDEHCRPTTSLTEVEKLPNFDSKREESFLEPSGLYWHTTSKTLLGADDSLFIQPESPLELDARSRADNSQKESRASQTKVYESPPLFSMSPSTTITKRIKYICRSFGNNTYDQNSRIRFHLNSKNLYKPTGNIFRSSSMHAYVSADSWNVTGNHEGSKPIRVCIK